jgi:hypothetical protein
MAQSNRKASKGFEGRFNRILGRKGNVWLTTLVTLATILAITGLFRLSTIIDYNRSDAARLGLDQLIRVRTERLPINAALLGGGPLDFNPGPRASFNLRIDPSSKTVIAPATIQLKVTVEPLNGFQGTVVLVPGLVSQVRTGPQPSLSPAQNVRVSANGTAFFTVTIPSGAQSQTFPAGVIGVVSGSAEDVKQANSSITILDNP